MSAFDKAWSLLKQEGKPTLPPCPHCGHVDHDWDYVPGGLHYASCPEPEDGGCGTHGTFNDDELAYILENGSLRDYHLQKQQFPGFPFDQQGALAQALARQRPPQQPLQITNLPPRETLQEQYKNNHRRMPPQMVQSQLPTELTQGAHVAPFKIFGQQ